MQYLENVAKRITTVVYERANYDNYGELTDIVYDFGKTYDVMVKIVSPDGIVVASYPSVMNMVSSRIKNEKTYVTSILLNDDSKLGTISIALPKYSNYEISKITYVGIALLIIVILFIQLWSSSSIKSLVSEIALLSNYDKTNSGKYRFVETQCIHNALVDKSELMRRYERDCAMALIARHVAHDIRSPISVLSAYLNIGDNLNADDTATLKGAAERSVVKLTRMADELVDYSKADRVAKSACNISDLCGAVVEETADEARKDRVSVDCMCNRGAVADLDSYRIERVLVNLVRNAIQASSGKVVLNADTAEGADLLFTVSDNGKGILGDDLPHIFDSFFTKGKKGGTGLGLAYCKQVVEAHGGTIGVESEIGKGTTFTIILPGSVEELSDSC